MKIKVNKIYVYNVYTNKYIGEFEFTKLGLKLAYLEAKKEYKKECKKVILFGISEKCGLFHISPITNNFKQSIEDIEIEFLLSIFIPGEDYFFKLLEYFKTDFKDIGEQLEQIFRENLKRYDIWK